MPSQESTLEIVDVGPYDNFYLNCWDAFCLQGIAVFTKCFDSFLSSFVPTTKELQRPIGWYLNVIVAIPFWALCTILSVPMGLLFFLLWVPISNKRKPYRYSYVKNAMGPGPELTKAKKTYSCATANVCIMHEVLTRFNNQRNPLGKARDLGRNIVTRQLGITDEFVLMSQKGLTREDVERLKNEKLQSIGYTEVETKTDGYDTSRNGRSTIESTNANMKYRSRANLKGTKNKNKEEMEHSILTEFPDLDFLLVQETWELGSTRELVHQLHQVFPYIVYDARVDTFESNAFLLNSGTLIASRYPIVEADFDWFRCCYRQCRLASMGLLQVKVTLGTSGDGRKVTGYLSNTHLQSYQGIYPIHASQMNDILKWTESFRSRTHEQDEVVAFDLCGGDFNTDNMSPVDQVDWKHPLFDVYEDVCRLRPGRDHDWTVGTEMRHTPLHDQLTQTPLGLQMALQHPALLQHYVLSADITECVFEMAYDMPSRDQHGRIKLSPEGGRRRIDYVLYRKGDGVKVKACDAVTQLAGLTDHVPYCLTFDVTI